jgi:hypothetical protein
MTSILKVCKNNRTKVKPKTLSFTFFSTFILKKSTKFFQKKGTLTR